MKNGFLTHDETAILIEGLNLLFDRYINAASNPELPTTLRQVANRRCEECKRLTKEMEAWKNRV